MGVTDLRSCIGDQGKMHVVGRPIVSYPQTSNLLHTTRYYIILIRSRNNIMYSVEL